MGRKIEEKKTLKLHSNSKNARMLKTEKLMK